jgi:hypothetical protein
VNKLFATAAIAVLALAGSAQASELLTNGTFDAGNTGFQSQYAYAVTHDLYPEGTAGTPLIGAAGSAFTFSFWLASVYPTSPASLHLLINGEQIQGVTFNALGGSQNLGVWQNFSYSGVSGAQGITSIALTNSNLEPSGNDFALDDLSLQGTAVPEPTSWALMIMGFSSLGAALRANRRRLVRAVA